MPPVKSLGNSRAKYNYKFGLTGLEAADPYVPPGGPIYSDDVFSTYLYEGNKQENTDNPPTTQDIINGIDNVNNKGLIWQKTRSYTGSQVYTMSHYLTDTVRGAGNVVYADRTLQQTSEPAVANFYNNGFEVGSNNILNNSLGENVAWNFRAAPGFFDIQEYTGDANNSQVINHNLGCKPGMVMIKRTNGTGGDWAVYFKSGDNDTEVGYGVLNNNNGFTTSNIAFTSTAEYIRVYSSSFAIDANADGATYIMYIFAQGGADTDARKFGTNQDESIIKCGTWTASSGAATIDNLGWEPQFVLVKNVTDAGFWGMFDIMRGMPVGDADPYFSAHTDGVESSGTTNFIDPLPNGFKVSNLGSSQTFAYMAIRRPHKPITVPTKLFTVGGNTSSEPEYVSNFVVDMAFHRNLGTNLQDDTAIFSRLTGSKASVTNSTASETTPNAIDQFDFMDGWGDNQANNSSYKSWMFRRAPGFFDVVAYDGDSDAARQIPHNLEVKPEMIIIKNRSYTSGTNWTVWHKDIYDTTMVLNDNQGWVNSGPTSTYGGSGTGSSTGTALLSSTSTYFKPGSGFLENSTGETYISYHFASLSGVSKIGTYTGTGGAFNVDCGFSSSARFVLIKRADEVAPGNAGGWRVYDTSQGIVDGGNDPYINLNDNDPQVTNNDGIDPYQNGFALTGSGNFEINANGGTYIYLAIA